MSYHSGQYLNRKMKKGNTDKTGTAWWYDPRMEDPNNPSHYSGFIPVDVVREFFGWTAEESTVMNATFHIAEPPASGVDATPIVDEQGDPVLNNNGQQMWEYVVRVEGHKALGRGNWVTGGIPDGEEDGATKILSVVTEDYGVHQAKQIFLDNVIDLVGGADNLGIESIGELKWGKRLFSSISIPENLINDESGLEFRPILTICTSFDRTLATQYVRTYGIPVCDNTLDWELTKAGRDNNGNFKIRHSKNSATKLSDAKRVLGLLTEQADEFNKWVDDLVKAEVPEKHFIQWLDKMVPIPEVKTSVVTVKSIQGEDTQVEKVTTNGQTIALKKRDKLVEMWDRDARVAPWKNTRLGILQLWNTFLQHEASFKGVKAFNGDANAARAENNMNKMIEGKFTDEDMVALKAISNIQAQDDDAKILMSAPKKPRAKAGAGAVS